MNKLNEHQQELYDNSKPYKNLSCSGCSKGKFKFKFKEFINGGGKVCDRCLFYYKCKTCKKGFKIYSDGEILITH